MKDKWKKALQEATERANKKREKVVERLRKLYITWRK